MSQEQKDPKEKEAKPKEQSSCMEMMGKMMGSSEEGVSCESFISKFLEADENSSEMSEMMSQMSGCGCSQEDSKEA